MAEKNEKEVQETKAPQTEDSQKSATTQKTSKRERHEFILTVNGFIVCQRYFHIENFKRNSYNSVELVEAVDECVAMIHDDLKKKSLNYLTMSAPQVFDNLDEANNWIANPLNRRSLKVPAYALTRDDEKVYTWDGEKFNEYDKYFNKADYLTPKGDEPEKPWELKFAFLDYGREVVSKVWDGNVYPRFVRINIDLSNSKNRYEGEGMPYDSFMMKNMNEGMTEIISSIVDKLTEVCSYEENDDYTTTAEYGERTYNLNIRAINDKYIRKAEAKCRKKTEAYFRSIGVTV